MVGVLFERDLKFITPHHCRNNDYSSLRHTLAYVFIFGQIVMKGRGLLVKLPYMFNSHPPKQIPKSLVWAVEEASIQFIKQRIENLVAFIDEFEEGRQDSLSFAI